MLFSIRLAGFALVALLFGFIAVSAQDRNSITGFVFGDDRSPVSRLNVELQTDLYSTVARTQTNGSGMYSFRGLPSGSYVVKVLSTGTNFEEQSKSVSLVPISAVQGRGAVAEQVDFYLRSRRGSSGPHGPAGVVYAQDVPKEAKELYDAALDDLDKKQEEAGYAKLKQALEIFPRYYMALDRLANEYLAKGHFEAALVLFSNALAVNPRSTSSGMGLGVTEYRLNRLDKSLKALDEVLKLDQENVNAHYWRGIVLHASKKLGEAVSALQRADQLSEGKFPDVQWQLARVYKDQNKFSKSADALEAFLKLKPNAENAEEIKRIIQVLREKRDS